MFGGYPPTAIGYPPTAIGCPPTAIGYPPTAIGHPPTTIGYTPTAIGYPPTAIGYPPTAIVGRIGHSEFFFFFFITAPPAPSNTSLPAALHWGVWVCTLLLAFTASSEVMLGDTMGNIYCVETRKCAKRVVTSGKLRPSSTGSIRAMALHPQQPCIASAGLGRKVLVHDIRERALITKVRASHACSAHLPLSNNVTERHGVTGASNSHISGL